LNDFECHLVLKRYDSFGYVGQLSNALAG